MLPEYFVYLCFVFSFLSAYAYIKGIIKGETKPNIVSWIFWSIAPLIGVYFGYKSGVKIPLLLSTFNAGFFPLIIVIVSLFRKNSYWKISWFDILCGTLSLFAIIIWIITKNGFLSVICAMLADLFASIPTIIKSWKHSETEVAETYAYGILNQIITFLVMKNLNTLSLIFPIYFFVINSIIVIGIKNKTIFKFDNKPK